MGVWPFFTMTRNMKMSHKSHRTPGKLNPADGAPFLSAQAPPKRRKPPFFPVHRWASILFLVGCLCACGQNDQALERILAEKKLVVVTSNSAHSYYIYRDQEMGFEYELAKAFSDFLGVRLEIRIADTWGQMLPLLKKQRGHIVAASLPITPSRKRKVDFSKGYLPVQQMVIVHKKHKAMKTLEDLSGKTIHIPKGSSYEERLRALARSGLDIIIQTIDDVSTEELISDVAEEKIEVTIAYSNIALLNRRYYPDVRIAFPIESPQNIGWAVKKGEHALRDKIDSFFHRIAQDGTFQQIYNRYYAYVERFDRFEIKKFQERVKTRLPNYENAIRKAATENGLDWRLVAALIYQESQFRPRAKSFTGVKGMMQLTLSTAQDLGVANRLDPHQSIEGGTKYLKSLIEAFSEASERDSLMLAIAAYNVGKGHVRDAQNLAVTMGMDPNKWSSVEKTLPLLRQKAYYKNSKYGYCRGAEPVFQVRRVMTYYDILKRRAIKVARAKNEVRLHVDTGTEN